MDYSPLHQSFRCTPETLLDSAAQKNIEAWLKSLQQDSPANLLVMPEIDSENLTTEMGGRTLLQSFASFSLATSCWRTYQVSFLQDTLEQSWVTFPRAGMIANGTAYQLRPLAPITREIVYGSSDGIEPWPSPTVPNGGWVISKDAVWKGKKQQVGLESAVRRWPTPTEDSANERKTKYAQGGTSLSLAVKLYPTSTVTNSSYTSQASKKKYKSGPTLLEVVRTFPTPRATLQDMGSLEMSRYSGQARKAGREEARYDPKNGGQLNPN